MAGHLGFPSENSVGWFSPAHLTEKIGKRGGAVIPPIRNHVKNGANLNTYKDRLQPGAKHQSALGYNGDRDLANTNV